MDYYIVAIGRTQRFYHRPRTPRHPWLALGTCNTPNQHHPLRFIGISDANNASTASYATNTPSPPRAWTAVTSSFIGPFFVQLLHHPVPQRPWPYQDRPLDCAFHVSMERQQRIRVSAKPQYREPSSRGTTAFQRTLPCPYCRS